MPGGKQPRPVSARYDAYLILAVAAAFLFAGIWGVTHPEAGWFLPFMLTCGGIALAAVLIILLRRR